MGGHYTIGQNHLTLAERGNGWALYNWSESPYLGAAGEWVGTIQLDRISRLTLAERGNGWTLYNWSESVTLPWYTGVVGTELLYYKIRSDKTACGTWMELDQCPYPVQGIPLNLITVKNAIMMWFFSVYKTWGKRCTYLFFILSEEKVFFITFMSNK